jgi:hypothetical protein
MFAKMGRRGPRRSHTRDLQVQFRDAIGSFFVEFSKFETQGVGLALRSLSRDPGFVEHAEHLLDLEARLKLLERMAFVRGAPVELIAELEACRLRARKLCEQRDQVARNLKTADLDGAKPLPAARKPRSASFRKAVFSRLAGLETLCVPDIVQVREYAEEAVALQETLRGITQTLERRPPAAERA